MEQQPSQPDLTALLRHGDPGAAALLWQRYADRLIALARQHLDERLRGKVDPEDVLLSVMRSFYRRHGEGGWDLRDANVLWPLLVRLTVRKCHRRLEEFLAARRDVRREVAAADGELTIVDRAPTPEEAALLTAAIETVMKRLSSDLKRRIFELSLQGYTIVEISERVSYYERGVERVRAEIRSMLQAMLADDHLSHD